MTVKTNLTHGDKQGLAVAFLMAGVAVILAYIWVHTSNTR